MPVLHYARPVVRRNFARRRRLAALGVALTLVTAVAVAVYVDRKFPVAPPAAAAPTEVWNDDYANGFRAHQAGNYRDAWMYLARAQDAGYRPPYGWPPPSRLLDLMRQRQGPNLLPATRPSLTENPPDPPGDDEHAS